MNEKVVQVWSECVFAQVSTKEVIMLDFHEWDSNAMDMKLFLEGANHVWKGVSHVSKKIV